MIFAAITPNVVGHLKPDDEDAKMKFVGTLSQSVGPMVLVDGAHLRPPVRRVVLVHSFTLTL